MLRKSALILSLSGISCVAQAAEVDVALTENTIQGTYITDAPFVGVEGTDLSLGMLLSDDRDIVGSAALMSSGVLENLIPGPLSVSIGGRAYAALLDDPDDDVFGLAPGAEARLTLPFG